MSLILSQLMVLRSCMLGPSPRRQNLSQRVTRTMTGDSLGLKLRGFSPLGL